MKTETKKNRLLSIAAGGLLISAITIISYLTVTNHRINTEKESAIIKADSALSVKLLMEKAYDETKSSLNMIESNYQNVQKKLNEALFELEAKQTALEKLQKDNANVNTLRKQIADLKRTITNFEFQISGLSKDKENLLVDLDGISKSKQLLLNENEILRGKLEAGKKLRAHNIEAQALKGKNKNRLTFRARKTKKIIVDFDIAENAIADAGNRNIFLVITQPNGVALNSPQNIFTKIETGEQTTYSAKKEIEYKNRDQHLSLTYDLKNKAIKGKYKIEIFADGVFCGKRELVLK